MLDVEAKIVDDGGLDREIDRNIEAIRKVIPKALEQVGAEMILSLQKHIHEDWYLPWGAPQQYERRTDKGNDNALGSSKNMTVEVKNNRMVFEYSPKSNPVGYPIAGDSLIEIIQTAGWKTLSPAEDKQGRMIMPRPFWDKFIEEQENGGIMTALLKALQKYGITEQDLTVSIESSRMIYTTEV